ncbi:MAG: hypothetical protein MEQ07_10655 [Aquimonas sp.]|nr:hypothetical protein [Aquimonas sp.]
MAQSRGAPPPEFERARQALSAALAEGADVHASREFAAAEALLQESRAAGERRRRGEQVALAERAELEARLAEARAITLRLRAEVEAKAEDNQRLRRELLDGALP